MNLLKRCGLRSWLRPLPLPLPSAPAGLGQVLVRAEGLCLEMGGRVLLHGLDWQCRSGERWAVIGRNAAGKTTLLRAIAGLPAGGQHGVPRGGALHGGLRWLERPWQDWDAGAAAAFRAFMPQLPQDRFSISVDALLCLSVCVPGAWNRDQLLASLDLLPLRSRDVMRLSGGERQRVALAQCAIQGASLLLLDEPVSFQDPAHQMAVAAWLRSFDGLPSMGVLFSAHDVNWAAAVATHVLALDGDGAWRAGSVDLMLTPESLEKVYGCKWERAGRALVAVGASLPDRA